jgi:hypothetical protein
MFVGGLTHLALDPILEGGIYPEPAGCRVMVAPDTPH